MKKGFKGVGLRWEGGGLGGWEGVQGVGEEEEGGGKVGEEVQPVGWRGSWVLGRGSGVGWGLGGRI